MLARTVQAPAWSNKQAYVCRACRRQWQMAMATAHQRRGNSQQNVEQTNVNPAATSDSWFDALNDISDEYSSHKSPQTPKPPKFPGRKDEEEDRAEVVESKSKDARPEANKNSKPDTSQAALAHDLKSLQELLSTSLPATLSGHAVNQQSSQNPSRSNDVHFKTVVSSEKSRRRDRRKKKAEEAPTGPRPKGAVHAAHVNGDFLASLLSDLQTDANRVAAERDGRSGHRKEANEAVKDQAGGLQSQHNAPRPFPIFKRGPSHSVDNVDVPADKTMNKAAIEQPKVWKAKTSPSDSGLGGPVIDQVPSEKPMGLLDRFRYTQARKPWGGREDPEPSPQATFNTLSQADRTSPKKTNQSSIIRSPFGIFNSLRSLWRGPSKQTVPDEAPGPVVSEENVSETSVDAPDMKNLRPRVPTDDRIHESATEEYPLSMKKPGAIQRSVEAQETVTLQNKREIAQLEATQTQQPDDVEQAEEAATESLAGLHVGRGKGDENDLSSTTEHTATASQRESSAPALTLASDHDQLETTQRTEAEQAGRARSSEEPGKDNSANAEQILEGQPSPKTSKAVSGSQSPGREEHSTAKVSKSQSAVKKKGRKSKRSEPLGRKTGKLSSSHLDKGRAKKAAVKPRKRVQPGDTSAAKGTVAMDAQSSGVVGLSLADAMKHFTTASVPHKQPSIPAKSVTESQKPSKAKVAAAAIEPAVLEAEEPVDIKEKSEVDVISAQLSELEIQPLDVPQPPVPYLEYGLNKVLFNPGVYQLQDAASRVYNFDPYLQKIMPVEQFDFNSLKEYKTSSKDTALAAIAKQQGKRYIGSTSSMTSSLAHFHYLISNWRPLNLSMLSHGYVGKQTSAQFTNINRAPSAIFLRWKNGSYAIDADKEYDSANVLMLLGKSMELLLTLPKDEYEKYRKTDSRAVSEERRTAPESYQYTTMGDFLMRSQLDAYDPRLPGNGTFDLKTRAVVSVRMSARDHEGMTGYEIYGNHGKWSSYEKEYHDMARAAMLKYMLQVRMGRMNGIFVAYHNIKRIFGFQYIPIADLDLVLHGQSDACLGDQEFKASLKIMNDLLNKATTKFPEQSLRIHFETQSEAGDTPTSLHMVAEPMTEEEIDSVQDKQKAKIEEYERKVMGKEATDDANDGEDASSTQIDEAIDGEDASSTQAGEAIDGESASSTQAGEAIDGENASSTEAEAANPTQPTAADDEASAYARQKLSFRSTDAPADQPFLDGVQETETTDIKPLFYATVIVQSEVNGFTVDDQPKNLKQEDTWQLNYLIKDYEITRYHWALYEDMRARRKQALYFEQDEADDAEADAKPKVDESKFIEFLKTMSRRGEEIREKQDQADRESGQSIVRVDDPLPSVREKVETLEDYMAWMYRKEQV